LLGSFSGETDRSATKNTWSGGQSCPGHGETALAA
jgi:hypothetical protein